MDAMDLSYIAMAIQPFGGILVAIPLAILHLQYPVWLVVATAPFLAYVQVLVVDLLWNALDKIPAWRRMLERRRSPRMERVMAGGGAFWTTFLTAPLVGPWVIMAFMRFARVPQRRIAVPILLSMLSVTLVVTALCLAVPVLFD